MDIATLQAQPRKAQGTREARRLRRTGKLPGIVYGHGETPEPVMVDKRELANLLAHGAHLVTLKLDGRSRSVLIKEVQFDHLGSDPIHVDFTLVDLHERVKVRVPLEFRGTPVGLQEGGILDTALADLEVECLVTEIPESLRVNVADLKLGSSLHVKDIALPADVSAVTPAETIVCTVRAKIAAEEEVAAPAEEAAAEPEIIGRKEKPAAQEEESKE